MSAYHAGFLMGRGYSCPHCFTGGYSMRDFSREKFIHDFIHIGDSKGAQCKYNKKRGIYVVNKEKFEGSKSKCYVECPNCRKRIKIKCAED